MTQIITQEQAILEKLRTLPPQKQQEVLDFIEFLHSQIQKQETEENGEAEPISLLEAAKDYIGCVEGPADLSLRKKLFKRGY